MSDSCPIQIDAQGMAIDPAGLIGPDDADLGHPNRAASAFRPDPIGMRSGQPQQIERTWTAGCQDFYRSAIKSPPGAGAQTVRTNRAHIPSAHTERANRARKSGAQIGRAISAPPLLIKARILRDGVR
jgi:hypothetical protein